MEITKVIEHNRKTQNHLFRQNEELRVIRDELLEASDLQKERKNIPVIATGHQPTIYYPGLLFKNFFTGDAAKQLGGKAINFVVDSDRADFRIPVPYQQEGELHKMETELKNRKNKIYAAFNPSSEEIFNFFDKIGNALESLSHASIPEAFDQYRKAFFGTFEKHQNFTDTVIDLRNRFDDALGYTIRDVRISHIARSKGYYRYILYLIRHLRNFTEAYNDAVRQCKRKDYQPVKFLDHQKGWYELPFWLCKNSKRYPVYVKKNDEAMHFYSEEADTDISVNIHNRTQEELIQALRDSLTLYPKATTLTIMIRLFLCDVFVHGTGAIEYEKVNNTILHEFFSLDSRPYFYGVTGDIWLPLAGHEGTHNGLEKEYKRKKHWLEEADRDPEKYLPRVLAEQYKGEKKQLARQMQQEEDPDKRRELHQQLMKKDEEMKQYLKPEMEKVRKTLARYDKLLSRRDVYFERKYPYFIFPPEYLTEDHFRKNLKICLKPD
ncbi:MAG: hypothetical protein V5A51_08580 [Bacteroidales bacterium]